MRAGNKTAEDVTPGYYESVAGYYDSEASGFEQRYKTNPILQKIRNDFRSVTEQYSFTSALEIGCGTGMDLIYFAKKYPNAALFGIDISPQMVDIACSKIREQSLSNVRAEVGAPEELANMLPADRFDLIYCYFGALNTVENLEEAAKNIRSVVSDKGTLVLTFVNKWYLMDILINLLILRFKKAFARINNSWSGYSPSKHLASVCRSEKEIRQYFFRDFEIVYKKGYSIFYPAWYRHKWMPADGMLGRLLWRIDSLINKTPLRNFGEYSLYVLKSR